jgi:hypothetical protein
VHAPAVPNVNSAVVFVFRSSQEASSSAAAAAGTDAAAEQANSLQLAALSRENCELKLRLAALMDAALPADVREEMRQAAAADTAAAGAGPSSSAAAAVAGSSSSSSAGECAGGLWRSCVCLPVVCVACGVLLCLCTQLMTEGG